MALPFSIHNKYMYHLTDTNILTAGLRGLTGTDANLLLVCPGSQCECCRATYDAPSRFPCQVIPPSTTWSVYIGVSVDFNVRPARVQVLAFIASLRTAVMCFRYFTCFVLVQEVFSSHFYFSAVQSQSIFRPLCSQVHTCNHLLPCVVSFTYLC